MTKKEAIDALGGTHALAAQAIGVSRPAIYRWPDLLTPRIQDRVVAAQLRLAQAKKRKPMAAAA